MAKKKAKKTAKPARKATKAVKKTAKKKSSKPAAVKANKKTAAKPAPRLTSINPYITMPGNCEDAFNFYKSVFGGKFGYIGRFKDMPPTEGQPPIPASESEKIMHISLPISAETVLMGSDSSEAFGQTNVTGNNFSISVNASSQSVADKLFNGLSNGGQVTMPIGKTFWGAYFGMCTDKFGIQWMLNFDLPPAK